MRFTIAAPMQASHTLRILAVGAVSVSPLPHIQGWMGSNTSCGITLPVSNDPLLTAQILSSVST